MDALCCCSDGARVVIGFVIEDILLWLLMRL